jgi:4-azaleucine resistance transporter AzlC
VGLLAAGASLASAALAVFLLNARHIFYGISLVDTYKDFKGKPYLIFALTDETYSLVTQNQPPEGMSKNKYCLLVSALDHSYWILGCCLGALVGNLIPINYEGVEFVLTAMFVTLLTEQWLTNKNHTAAILGVVCTALSLFLLGKEYFLIPAMVLIAISLLVLQKTGRRDRHA